MRRVYPNLIIAGAPKCGSTTLFRYLSNHPSITFTSIKEPGYFIADYYNSISKESPNYFRQRQYLVLEKNKYEALFKNIDSEYAGDASISYLFQYQQAIEKIKESCNDNVKIVFILRHPVKRLISQYKYICELGFENLNIHNALEQEEERLRSGWSSIYAYKSQGLYAEGIHAFMNTFSDVHVMFFEDLIKSPQDEMNTLFKFLNLEPIRIGDKKIYNKGGIPKSRFLHNFLMNKNPVRSFIAAICRVFLSDSKLLLVRDKLRGVNQQKTKLELPSEVNKELEEYYRPDLLSLEKVLKRSIPWRLD